MKTLLFLLVCLMYFFSLTAQNNADPEKCIIVDKSQRYFIPNTTFRMSDATDCVNCLNDYKITYDLSRVVPTICYYKKVACDCGKADKSATKSDPEVKADQEKCNCPRGKSYCYVQVKRLKPAVGKTVGFHVFGYYPYFDSLKFTFGFDSKNLELKDQFTGTMTLQPNTKNDTDKAQVAKAAPTKENSSQLNANVQFFQKMEAEFISYKNYLIEKSPDIMMVKSDVEYINQQLNQYCLVVKEFTPQGLINATEEYLKNFSNDIEKKTVMDAAQKAAGYYAFIISYNAIKIPAVQIENEDQFKWAVNFYKGKNVAASRNYYQMIKGGIKIDFSTGFAFNSLIDKKYAIQYDLADAADDDVTTKVDAAKIVELKQGKYLVDIGLMAHVYPRTGSRFNIGGNTGVVIRNGSNVKYLLGGSIMLGYEQRFIISGGVIGGNVDVLDQTYDNLLNTYVTKAKLTSISSSVPTMKSWQFGSYLAITYNLGGTTIPAKK